MNRRVLLPVCSLLLTVPFGASADDKVPITTSSDAALKSYIQGRELSEKLRGNEARPHFAKAVELDPDFAMAYLSGSLTQATNREFFEYLEAAVARIDKVSQGEKDWILGFQAGVNGETLKQREHYDALVAAYPDDERAHNLLGNHWFGQQNWVEAIRSYERATAINPDYSQSYNQMGYARRFMENFEGAAKAFQKYIELIPDDPNPYDSYAELLLKTGKFEASIENYRKALEADPNFVASHVGIATNLNYLGRHHQAREQLGELRKLARDDGEQRGALFAAAVSFLDEGNIDKALEAIDAEQIIAERNKDAGLKAGDLINKGNITLEQGRAGRALTLFEEALATVQASERSEKVKNNAGRIFLFNAARVEIARDAFDEADKHIATFETEIAALGNPFFNRQLHELRGTLALAKGDFDAAIAELIQANQQNPYNLYRIALAHKRKGDASGARTWLEKTTNFNALNGLNYALIRMKATEMLGEVK